MSNHYGWSTPPTDVMDRYIEKCALFVRDDIAFSTFKRDKDYTKILEGNEMEVARIALEGIKKSKGLLVLKEHMEAFRENETVGDPKVITTDVGTFVPSTLRYVNTVLEVKEMLGEYKPKSIIEIGGGYGGLCKTMSVLYDFDSYTIVDLPEVIALSKKYLDHFPIGKKVKYISCSEPIEGNYDLFIADSSMSECDGETELKYIEIAKKCPYVYIVHNTTWMEGRDGNKLLQHFVGYNYNITIMPANVVIFCLSKL